MNEVKSPKKPLIFYYVIAIIIVILFNALLMPWFSQRQVQAVDYNEFLDMVESGQAAGPRSNSRKTASSSPIRRSGRFTAPPWWTTPT